MVAVYKWMKAKGFEAIILNNISLKRLKNVQLSGYSFQTKNEAQRKPKAKLEDYKLIYMYTNIRTCTSKTDFTIQLVIFHLHNLRLTPKSSTTVTMWKLGKP